MSGLTSVWRRRRLFAPPTLGRRSLPRWSWIPFAALAGALMVLAAARALGLDGPGWYRWLTDPRQSVVPGVFLAAILAAAALYARSRSARGRVVGVLSVSAFALGAVLLGLASYLPCSVDGPPFFEQLIWVLSGNGAEPWGDGVSGCPAPAPLAHHLARLCALWGALASVVGVVVAVLRRQLDRWLAASSNRSVVVLGASAQAATMVRAVAAHRAPGTALLVVDHTGDEAFSATVRALGGRVVAAEGLGADLLRSLLTRRRRIAVESVHIIEERVPEALATFTQVAEVLDAATPDPMLVGRVQVRIDDPWAAENWRRDVTGTERAWLADALSATEQTARAIVARVELLKARRLLVAGEGDLAAALLAEVARCERERRVLRSAAFAQELTVVVIGTGADQLAAEHAAHQARFGNDPGIADLRVIAEPARDAVLVAAAGEPGTVLVIADSGPGLTRPTRLAGQLPEVTILAADAASSELPGQPLVGRLISFGVGLLTGDEPPEDHWTRMARLLHAAYLAQLGDGAGDRPSTRPWSELPTFYRRSNLRQVHSLFAGVAQLGRSWAAEGAAEELDAAEIDFLSRLEHESWRRFYLANGWRPAPARDDTRLAHDWLVDWDALPPAARVRTSASVRRSLALLETAGYRSRRRTAMLPFRRRGEVRAVPLSEPRRWRTESGAEMTAAAGDWLVTDPATRRQWTSDERAFLAGHERLAENRYRRNGLVRARPAHLGERVETLEGPAVAQPGEWLVEGALQEHWLVPGERFRDAYEPV